MEQRDLFAPEKSNRTSTPFHSLPLAARMRPKILNEFIGQQHLLGSGQLLERLIRTDCFSSLIFYGPPGTGKTSLASLIANETHRRFVSLSAVTSNVREVRQVIEESRLFLNRGQKTILFVDEIHRFNKAQQDILLPHIENGTISFIGATTHNPFFSIISPLVSRSQVFRLKSLNAEEVKTILQRALSDPDRGLGKEAMKIDEEAILALATFSQGDARQALNALEVSVRSTSLDSSGQRVLSKQKVLEALQEKPMLYDRDEDQHYGTISAFIKSVRGSDPDAALYWLAKMIRGGEDILFIARRLVILASEDIGNADPQALQIATSCLAAVEFVGLPEARIPLAQATIYLACAPKSNASYLAIEKALEAVEEDRVQEVPAHLKNVKAEDEKNEHYQYPHDFEGHYVDQNYLKRSQSFLELSNSGYEVQMAQRLKEWRLQAKKNPELPSSKLETP
jgi:putative ATPase